MVTIVPINGNEHDLNVTDVDSNGDLINFGVWKSDRGKWCAADVDGHVVTRATKDGALAWCRLWADCHGMTASERRGYCRSVVSQGAEAGFDGLYIAEALRTLG